MYQSFVIYSRHLVEHYKSITNKKWRNVKYVSMWLMKIKSKINDLKVLLLHSKILNRVPWKKTCIDFSCNWYHESGLRQIFFAVLLRPIFTSSWLLNSNGNLVFLLLTNSSIYSRVPHNKTSTILHVLYTKI